ncbi:MAG: spore coat U domain-containing protein [Pseudomonadota bacterium]
MPIAAVGFVVCFWYGPVQAALVCSATVDPLVLGQVSVRDGYSSPTFGGIHISCSGGIAGSSVQTCLRIGAGSGGATTGLSPRTLRGADGTVLDYQLTKNSAYSAGGRPLAALEVSVELDSAGSGAVAPSIYAQITALASLAKVGAYQSTFSGTGDLGFSFGETACTQTGEIAGFTVSANVTASCSVDATAMDFGIVNGHVRRPLDSSAQIFVSCTNATPYTVGLDYGTNASDATSTGRRMTNGVNTVHYGLFHSPSRSDSWGLTNETAYMGVGTGSSQSLNIYGRTFGDQDLASGHYSDSVVIVITY